MANQVSIDVDSLATIKSWVETHCGIHFAPGQETFFRRRVDALCLAERATPKELCSRVTSGDRALILRLAEAVSTNYTELFREPEMFDVLRDRILPSLPTGEVRIWSAAASSGEEAYSIAVLAEEHYGESAASTVRILGTDISERHIHAAEAALFSSQRLQVLDERRRAYFLPMGLGQFRPRPSLRKICTFRRLNLAQDAWPFEQRFHVIFLRNVLYYFDTAVRRRILEACYDVTEPGGWLVTSFTEPTLDLVTRWRQVQPALFRKEPA